MARVNTLRGGSGHYRVFVKHPAGAKVEITEFREVPTIISSYSSTDPFGDSAAVLSFPQVSFYDRPGYGDLWWLVPWAGVEISWYEVTEDGYAPSGWVWEGNVVSEEIGADLTVQCKGALYMFDNYLAAPFYPQYPVPYEKLIGLALDPSTHPSTRNGAFRLVWPSDWNVTVPKPSDAAYLWYLRPWGVVPGEKWSGLTTRITGSWDQILTGQVQTLLSGMYTPEGDQWTIRKLPGRIPELRVRYPFRTPDDNTMEVHLGVPGVEVSVSRDFTQSANVVYGAGSDLSGTVFSGAQVGTDGESTFYDPFSALPQVHPEKASNPRFIPTITRKESRMTFQGGIDELAARDISSGQIRRFADPGYVGTITLQVDPVQRGNPFNRLLIQAGSQILVKGFRGMQVLFHISAVEVSPQEGSVSLTVDSKFRDALTAAEVRARTRDALNPVYALQVGKQSVLVPDLLKPWSYSEGSGVIPSGSDAGDATDLFKKMPPNTRFPWTEWTTQFPPKKYPQYYVKVSSKGPRANDKWQDNGWKTGAKRSQGVTFKASQKGAVRLTQIAAFDINGNPIQIRFHFGIYYNSGITSTDMPRIPKGVKTTPPYAEADHYPFYDGAFEQFKPNGEEQSEVLTYLLPAGADQVIAWGTIHDPAGYSPGLFSTGAAKTGQLVDEIGWEFDTSGYGSFDKYSAANNAKNKSAGLLYAMIFQDDVPAAYFLGRCYTAPFGTTG